MSLRWWLGLLVAAAVIAVPTINVVLLHFFPPPVPEFRLADCPPVLVESGRASPWACAHARDGGQGAAGPGAAPGTADTEAGPPAPDERPPPRFAGEGGDPALRMPPREPRASVGFGAPLVMATRDGFGPRGGAFEAVGRHFLWINLVSLGIVVVLAMLAFSLIVRWPLRGLLLAIEDVEHGGIPAAGGMMAMPRELRQIGTALHRLARQLQGGNQERETMLAGMSHDLRSPLARIQAAIELRARPDEDWTPVLRDVHEIDHIIGQCIDYVRDGQDEPSVPLSLDELVRAVIRPASDQDVELALAAPERLPLRRQSMMRAVRNLIDNARVHGSAPIRVRTFREGGDAVLSVEDEGAGIDPQQWERLLKPFAQGARARSPGGAGLGLAIVQRVAAQHGGRLVMRVVSPGTPFAVQLRLPADSVG
ncbi:ATP-binding protein [Solimonas variicoloris]|uniref:ATP-binding protein n=1 Tax=Solimonas variicoloris TaxID=254408 RepID=UPI0003766F48|nr:ATP-binding protein [Solimonas variicoloris]